MKILHLLASPYFSGPAESLLLLAGAQRDLGHDVTVAFDRKRRRAIAEELLAPRVEGVGLASPLPLELSVKSLPWAMVRDARTLKTCGADVVHCHFSHDHLVARLGAPSSAVLIRSIHAPRSLRWTTPSADGWTVPTERLARRLIGRMVLVLPPLVSPAFRPRDRAEARKDAGFPEGRLVGMVSTFQASRRHEVGLQAFALLAARHPDARLVLVGDGERLAHLKALVARRGLGDRVHFTGYLSGPAFVTALQALDEVWVLGLGNDSAARVGAQARACNVRLVAVDEGALCRYADELVPPTAEILASVALQPRRLELPVESNAAIAKRVLELYERAAQRSREG